MSTIWTNFGLILLHLSCWFSIQAFGLSIFRYRLINFKKQLVLCSVLLMLLSILLQYLKLIIFISTIQPLCYFLCLCLLYHIRPMNSLVIVTVSYSFNTVLESTFNLLKSNFNFQHFIEISKNEYILQGLVIFMINLLLVFLLHKYRLGFTFLSQNNQVHLVKPSFSLKYYGIIVVAALTTASASIAIVHINQFFTALLLLIFFVTVRIVNLMYKKETSDLDS